MKLNYLYIEQMPLEKEFELWIGLLIDHARFMRNGFNTTEEQYFMEANNYSEDFIALSQRGVTDIYRDHRFLYQLQEEVIDFIVFKRQIARGIENCEILSILPAVLIDHIMKEAIFFSGILARIKNEPRPTWGDLGLPGQQVAVTAPQALIPELDRELEIITWEELLFWLKINYEHANVLSLYFRPEQEILRRRTMQWGNRIQRLYDQVLRVYQGQMVNPERFIEPSKEIISEWTDFLKNLYRQVDNCTIPGGQMNIWPRVIDHMIREAVYFIQVLTTLNRLYRA